MPRGPSSRPPGIGAEAQPSAEGSGRDGEADLAEEIEDGVRSDAVDGSEVDADQPHNPRGEILITRHDLSQLNWGSSGNTVGMIQA